MSRKLLRSIMPVSAKTCLVLCFWMVIFHTVCAEDPWPQSFTDTIPGDEGSPWPTWIEGRNDTILMAYGAAGDGKIHVTRSSDAGVSWQEISVLNYNALYPYLTRLADDRLVMVVYHDLYGPISWIDSRDDGRTWSSPHQITVDYPTDSPRTIHPYGPIIEMSDGRWAFCSVWAWRKKNRVTRALLVWSHDGGKTWSKPIAWPTAADGNHGLSEATIAQVAPQKYVAAIRSDEGGDKCWDGGYFSQSEDGVNWSVPKPFTNRVGEKVDMPKFYRIGDRWVLTYRLYNNQSGNLSALRLSLNGIEWSEPFVIGADKHYNNGPFLVRVKNQLIALNHRYPDRQSISRKVIDLEQLEK